MYRGQLAIRDYWWLWVLGCLFFTLLFTPNGWGQERPIMQMQKPQMQRVPQPPQLLQIYTPWCGAVEISPPQVTMSYTSYPSPEQTLILREGGKGRIFINEAPDVFVRIQYTLRNTTSYPFRFPVKILLGDRNLEHTTVTLSPNQFKTITQEVRMLPTNGYQRFLIEGPPPSSCSDDAVAIIIFFSAQLEVIELPL